MGKSGDPQIREILENSRTIAIVGISNKSHRASFGVAKYLDKFFEIYPVNPKLSEWEGKICYPSVLEIPKKIDILNIFRRSEMVLPVVEDAVNHGAKYIWMQLGIINEEAKQFAESRGITVVMDSCIAVEHSKLRSA